MLVDKFIDLFDGLLINIIYYFYSHIILGLFFIIHFSSIKFLKYKNDKKNLIFLNTKQDNVERLILHVFKIIFLSKNINFSDNRFERYTSYYKVL